MKSIKSIPTKRRSKTISRDFNITTSLSSHGSNHVLSTQTDSSTSTLPSIQILKSSDITSKGSHNLIASTRQSSITRMTPSPASIQFLPLNNFEQNNPALKANILSYMNLENIRASVDLTRRVLTEVNSSDPRIDELMNRRPSTKASSILDFSKVAMSTSNITTRKNSIDQNIKNSKSNLTARKPDSLESKHKTIFEPVELRINSEESLRRVYKTKVRKDNLSQQICTKIVVPPIRDFNQTLTCRTESSNSSRLLPTTEKSGSTRSLKQFEITRKVNKGKGIQKQGALSDRSPRDSINVIIKDISVVSDPKLSSFVIERKASFLVKEKDFNDVKTRSIQKGEQNSKENSFIDLKRIRINRKSGKNSEQKETQSSIKQSDTINSVMPNNQPKELEEVQPSQPENVELRICTLNVEQKSSSEMSSQENMDSQNVELKDRRNFRMNVPDLNIKAPVKNEQDIEKITNVILQQPVSQKKKDTLPFSALGPKPLESVIKPENCEVSIGRTNYLQIKILNKIMGDIVTPRLRAKKAFNGHGSVLQDLIEKKFVSHKGVIKREDIKKAFGDVKIITQAQANKNDMKSAKLSIEHKGKFDFNKKSFQTLKGRTYNSLRSPDIGSANSYVESLENDFLKTFDMTARISCVPQPKTHSRSILTEHNETAGRVSQNETLRRTQTVEKAVLEELLTNEFEDNYPKTLNDLDNKFSLPTLSDAGHRSFFHIGSPQHEKLTPILGNFSQLEKSGKQVNEKTILIQINPPIEEINSPIQEAYPDMEESNIWSPPKQVDLAACSLQRRITISFNIPNFGKLKKETFMYSEKSGKLAKEETIPSIENINDDALEKEKVVKMDVYRDFVKNVEEIFKFDEIYSCQLTNLNFKFQKIRIKSNFFSFLERIMQHSIRGIHDSYALNKLYPVRATKHYKNNASQFTTTIQETPIYSLGAHYRSEFTREDVSQLTAYLTLSSKNSEVECKEYIDDTQVLQHKLKKSESLNLNIVGKQKIIAPTQNSRSRRTIQSTPIILFIGKDQILNTKKPSFSLGLFDIKGLFRQFEDSWPDLTFTFDMVRYLNDINSDFLTKHTFVLHKSLLFGKYESTLMLDSEQELPQIKKAPTEDKAAPQKRATRRGKTYHEIPEDNEEEKATGDKGKFRRKLKKYSQTTIRLKPFDIELVEGKVRRASAEKDKDAISLIISHSPSSENIQPVFRPTPRGGILMPRTTSEGNRERRNSLSVPKENTKKGFFKFTSYQVPEVEYNSSIYLNRKKVEEEDVDEGQQNERDYLNVSINHSIIMPSPPKLSKPQSLTYIGKVSETKDQQFVVEHKEAHIPAGSITILERSQIQEIKNSKVLPTMTSRSSKERINEPSLIVEEKSFSKTGVLPTKLVLSKNRKSKSRSQSHPNEEKDLFDSIYKNRLMELQGLVQLYFKRIPHIRDEKGNTLLMIAARCGNEKAVRMLLVEHSDLNAQNSDGDTALHIALGYLHDGIADILINGGARQNIKNKRGKTPWELMPN